MVKKTLVAMDGSEHSLKAVELASDLAAKFDGELYLLHVINKVKVPEEFARYMESEKIEEPAEYMMFEKAGNKMLKEAEEVAKSKGVKTVYCVVEAGDPATKIIEFARHNKISSIFLGSRGLGDLKGLLMGSVSSKVCNLAECTCVTVK